MYRETLLHFDRPIPAAALEGALGVQIATRFHSGKPHLVFVGYEDSLLDSGTLVERARDAGYAARVVDL